MDVKEVLEKVEAMRAAEEVPAEEEAKEDENVIDLEAKT